MSVSEKKKKNVGYNVNAVTFFLDFFLLQKLIAFQVRNLFLLRVGEHIIVRVGLGLAAIYIYIYIKRSKTINLPTYY